MTEESPTPWRNLPSPAAVERHVGRNIRQRRIALGLSQERLGSEIGRTFQQIQKYENGANRVSAGRLYHIARVLGLSPGDFFAGLPSQDGTDATGVTYRRDALELAKAFARISDPEVRGAVLELVRSIAETESAAAEPASGSEPATAASPEASHPDPVPDLVGDG